MVQSVRDFHAAANRAYERNGYLDIRPGEPSGKSQVDVHGTTNWGRFKTWVGARMDNDREVLRHYGQAIKREYGEAYFKQLPSSLRTRLEGGMGWTHRSARSVIQETQNRYLTQVDTAAQQKALANDSKVNTALKIETLKQLAQDRGGALLASVVDQGPWSPPSQGSLWMSTDFKDRVRAQLAPQFFEGSNVQDLKPGDLEDAIHAVLLEGLSTLEVVQPDPHVQSPLSVKSGYALKALKKLGSVAPFGKTFDPATDVGKTFGNFKIIGAKPQGVEPGFTARKAWTQADTDKLLGGSHRYAQMTEGLLLQALTDQELTEVLARSAENAEDLQEAQAMNPAALRKWLASADGAPSRQTFLQPLRERLKQSNGDETSADAKLLDTLKSYVQQRELKFQKKHYIKLDYHERLAINRLLGREKYTIAARAHKGAVYNAIHRTARSHNVQTINRDAVREALANDLTRSFGVNTQKLKLVQTQYPSGEAKLLLDGTHITGRNPNDTYEDLDKSLAGKPKEGVLVKTEKDEDGKTVKRLNSRGHMEVDRTLQGLGRSKIFFLLLADRDAVGNKGQNKGRIGNEFAAIDPGKSLEVDRMNQRGDFDNDFSVRKPSVYKNFSIFDQTPYSERMEGVKALADLAQSKTRLQMFDEYRKQFGEQAAQAQGLNFDEDLQNMSRAYDDRLQEVTQVFADRLAVYKFDFDPAGLPQEQAAAQTLDMVDTLEKITSARTWMQNGVELAFPAVERSDRRAWKVEESPDKQSLVFTMENPSSRAKERLDQFLRAQQGLPAACKWNPNGQPPSLTVPKLLLGSIEGNYFNMDALRRYDEVPDPQL